jgi:ribosomal protein S18 acetylase RimI-like enzyme
MFGCLSLLPKALHGPYHPGMVKTAFSIRHARPGDAEEIARVHDASWRDAYRGVIPGLELERMIARRGPIWWHSAIVRGTGLLVLDFDGGIFELYLSPQHQGLGLGRRLFSAARRELAEHGYLSTIVWALADNEKALAFYRSLGGQTVRRAEERFGADMLTRVAFGFVSAQVR